MTQVLEHLRRAGVSYRLITHPAVFTIEEMDRAGIDPSVEICKNLFLRDAKGRQHFLVVLKKEKRADLAALAQLLGTSKLSFASEDRLMRYLGLAKGAVTPLGVLNDDERHVAVFFDRDLLDCPVVGVHPDVNTATVALSPMDLIRVMEEHGNPVRIIEI